ncbi:39S ribosomal protein L51, mitochondrial [Scheffersomyces spartinae]|uniref:Large ribosomal subunit protein mL43 n=1 Tax=Scheffersomyces spartinae TaxID=45513 RepID=A0A9P7VEN7_9ASCO|nr:39S ribosomal protein L51, mitochondrial [Scheffersomyces spartinae]KAG7196058.1 39S ribosomal protein L51, mitochondrial [Scheffersomyces spartinae]
MPIKGIPIPSVARNGVGAFVKPCYKITIQYCNWGGSSNGVRQLLSNGKLNNLALENREIMFNIVKQKGHPRLTFHYNNDSVKEIECRNNTDGEILKKLKEYSQNSGNKLFKYNHKVLSINDSVRGIWSPMHIPKEHRHKI